MDTVSRFPLSRSFSANSLFSSSWCLQEPHCRVPYRLGFFRGQFSFPVSDQSFAGFNTGLLFCCDKDYLSGKSQRHCVLFSAPHIFFAGAFPTPKISNLASRPSSRRSFPPIDSSILERTRLSRPFPLASPFLSPHKNSRSLLFPGAIPPPRFSPMNLFSRQPSVSASLRSSPVS